MRMMRWASRTSENFLINMQGTIHAIKEMDLNSKFKEAIEAIKTVMMDLDLAKMAYTDELKKGGGEVPPLHRQ